MTSHTLPRDSLPFDFIESLGGRDRYIERMREHGRRLAQLREAQQRRPSQLTTTRDVEGLRRTAPAPPPPRSGVDNQWAPGTSPQELSRRLSENRQRRDESLEAHARHLVEQGDNAWIPNETCWALENRGGAPDDSEAADAGVDKEVLNLFAKTNERIDALEVKDGGG